MSNTSSTHESSTSKSRIQPDVGSDADLQQEARPIARGLSVDSWAVLLALVLAALVKLHILNTVKW